MKFVPKEIKDTADISRGKRTWKGFFKNLLSVLIVLGLIYVLLGFVADIIASNIPEEWEAKLTMWEIPESDGGEKFQRAKLIFEKLTQNSNLRPLPYKLFLLDMDVPNAVAVPGGSVGITRGLLKLVESEIGLATVLGHELGHHQKRHCLKKLGRTLIFKATMLVLFGKDGSSVMDVSLGLAESSHSRDQEREADDFGLRLVFKAYGNTDGCLEFFEMIQQQYELDTSPWHELMASHPPTEDRIDYLRELQGTLHVESE